MDKLNKQRIPKTLLALKALFGIVIVLLFTALLLGIFVFYKATHHEPSTEMQNMRAVVTKLQLPKPKSQKEVDTGCVGPNFFHWYNRECYRSIDLIYKNGSVDASRAETFLEENLHIQNSYYTIPYIYPDSEVCVSYHKDVDASEFVVTLEPYELDHCGLTPHDE